MKKLRQSVIFDILICVIVVAGTLFFIKPIIVSGSSMEGTLSDKDYLLISRQAYTLFSKPKAGDIIVFPQPDGDEKGKRLYIKRIIATEGQRIRIKNNKVIVDGKILNEDYIGRKETHGNINYTIPKGQVFVMGDNRENSSDSRMFGTINVKNITGKVIVRLYPFGKFGRIR